MRALSTAAAAQIVSTQIRLALFADLTFKTGTYYVWSGVGPILANGNTYTGIGSFGKLGDVTEGYDVNARGTTVELSGIDNTILGDSLAEIGALLPAVLTVGFFNSSLQLLGSQVIFSGVVDKPTVKMGVDTSTITLNLETRLLLLQRGTNRQWSQVDQQMDYPSDTAFRLVEALQNAAYKWS